MDILLIPGMWLDGSAWGAVVGPLEALGHHAVPLTLPGQGDGPSSATLDDQVAAVVAAIDALAGPPLVVGHSAAATLAWIAADVRPDQVAKVVFIGGFPCGDGRPYFDGFEPEDGVVRFPGWGAFEGPDSGDLDEEARHRIASAAIPVPESVTGGIVLLEDDRRLDVPVTLICPEFSPDQAKQWVEGARCQSWPRLGPSSTSTSTRGTGRCSAGPRSSPTSWPRSPMRAGDTAMARIDQHKQDPSGGDGGGNGSARPTSCHGFDR